MLGRKQVVKVNGEISSSIDVTSGVPQGSILGPLLFIIFINDINNDVINSIMSCYADDSKICKKIKNTSDEIELQQDIDKVFEWSKNNSMLFNFDKLEFIRFTSPLNSVGDNEHLYTANGSFIKRVFTCRDLGLYFDADATFRSHISGKISKARKLCGYIFRTFQSRKASVMMHLFKTIVIPIIEYCSIIWHPSQLHDIRSVERVQRDFTIRISDMGDLNYWERLKYLKVFSLERRRERYIILYTFKVIFGLVPNPGISWYFSERRGRMLNVPPLSSYFRNGYAQSLKEHSFFCLSPRLFNCLPKEIRNLPNININNVKHYLDEFLHRIPDEPRLCGYTQQSRSPSNSICDQVIFLH